MGNVRFDGRVAIVTGAGGGLGRTYALDLAQRGAAVVVNDLGGTFDGKGSSTSMADTVVEEIRAAGGKAVASYDSVATAAGGEAIVQKAIDAFGRVDVLINNAGTLRNAPLDTLPDSTLDAMLEVHLKGAFYVTRPAFRRMKAQRYGRILFASSAAGIFGNDDQSAYGAAKAGTVGLMNVLSQEGKAHGVFCNALLPTAASRMGEAMSPELMQASIEIVSERRGRRGERDDAAFRDADGDLPRERSLSIHARHLFGDDGPLRAGLYRGLRRLGGAARQARVGGGHRGALRPDLQHEEFLRA